MMLLSKMLGSQAETQLRALEMIPKGFQCDDKAYPSKKQIKVAHDKTTTKAQ